MGFSRTDEILALAGLIALLLVKLNYFAQLAICDGTSATCEDGTASEHIIAWLAQ
jgi:hypothetical protein